MRRSIGLPVGLALLVSTAVACTQEVEPPVDKAPTLLSFAEYEALAKRDSLGAYIIEGDIVVGDRDGLERAYERYVASMQRELLLWEQRGAGGVGETAQPLTVSNTLSTDLVWSADERKTLTYCISAPDFENSGAGRYAQVVSTMEWAASRWESAGFVRFTHIADQDWNCDAGNYVVTFNVAKVTGSPFYAQAPLPHTIRSQRALRIDEQAFFGAADETLLEILTHELGHVLGFVHEQSRPEGAGCPERASSYRVLTAYDTGSIMHAERALCPQGNVDNATLSSLDNQGMLNIYGAPNLYFADLNNDNRADAVAVLGSGEAWVSLSNGSSFPTPVLWASGKSSGLLGTHLRDLTNDGRAELIMVDPTGITVRRNLGSSFDVATDWSEGPFYGARGTYFADLTNDKRADAIVLNDIGPVSVRKALIGSPPFDDIQTWTTAPEFGSVGVYFADVTNDGRADLIRVDVNSINVRRTNTTGTSFLTAQQWFAGTLSCNKGVFFADVTNDKRADLICIRDTAVFVGTAKSTNDGFNALAQWATGTVFGSRGTQFADVTGDGKADLIAVNHQDVVVRRASISNNAFGAVETWRTAFTGTE